MFLEKIFNLIFPPSCLGCGKDCLPGEVVCPDCFSGIEVNKSLFCGLCRTRLPEGKKICHRDFPYILGAAANYEGVAKELIRVLKFRFVKKAAEPLADLLCRYFVRFDFLENNWLVVPVPLSCQREKERGFNQAELIAKIFAKKFNFPVSNNVLKREKHSRPQSEISDFKERKINVKGVFFVADEETMKAKNILLIDDVTTSGATFFEAAEALKKSGARKIIALAVARA